MDILGRFRVQRNQSTFLSFIPIFHKRDGDLGKSDSQARYLVLVLASLIHATYFVLMGSRSGFPVMFLAYVLSAFSRALLTGMSFAFNSRCQRTDLIIRSASVSFCLTWAPYHGRWAKRTLTEMLSSPVDPSKLLVMVLVLPVIPFFLTLRKSIISDTAFV